MAVKDIDYYRQRAEAEALLALQASSADAAAAHNELAALYHERAYQVLAKLAGGMEKDAARH